MSVFPGRQVGIGSGDSGKSIQFKKTTTTNPDIGPVVWDLILFDGGLVQNSLTTIDISSGKRYRITLEVYADAGASGFSTWETRLNGTTKIGTATRTHSTDQGIDDHSKSTATFIYEALADGNLSVYLGSGSTIGEISQESTFIVEEIGSTTNITNIFQETNLKSVGCIIGPFDIANAGSSPTFIDVTNSNISVIAENPNSSTSLFTMNHDAISLDCLIDYGIETQGNLEDDNNVTEQILVKRVSMIQTQIFIRESSSSLQDIRLSISLNEGTQLAVNNITNVTTTATIKNQQVFTLSGTYTPTTDTTRAIVIVTGAGAAGGGASSGINKSGGSGGGAGGTQEVLMTIDDNITGTITIGMGGTGASGANGNAGENSILDYDGNTVTGNGGNGGVAGSNSSNGEFVQPAFSVGGSSSGIRILSSYTKESIVGTPAIYSTTSNTICSGTGGSTTYGGSGNSRIANGTSVGNGGFLASPTSGSGGGGAIQTNNSNQTGGTGGSGVVVIIEF